MCSLSSRFPPKQDCRSAHNICFHSWIFGGIKTSAPGSWRVGVHAGGTRPLILFSQSLPLTLQYPVWAWPELRGRAISDDGREGGNEGYWRLWRREEMSGGAVEPKLKGLTGWLLLWNVPLTAKARPPTAVCYRQVHSRGEAGGRGWVCERDRVAEVVRRKQTSIHRMGISINCLIKWSIIKQIRQLQSCYGVIVLKTGTCPSR